MAKSPIAVIVVKTGRILYNIMSGQDITSLYYELALNAKL